MWSALFISPISAEYSMLRFSKYLPHLRGALNLDGATVANGL